MAKKFSALKVR